MRTFHHKRNLDFCPSINVDRLWSMVPEGVYEKAKTDSTMAPVIDVTKLGYFKVLGKGNLPAIPLVVKAKFFSKEVIISKCFIIMFFQVFYLKLKLI
jgi:large subunit ribosomal protein L27Ae